jgi:hypothetical protein
VALGDICRTEGLPPSGSMLLFFVLPNQSLWPEGPSILKWCPEANFCPMTQSHYAAAGTLYQSGVIFLLFPSAYGETERMGGYISQCHSEWIKEGVCWEGQSTNLRLCGSLVFLPWKHTQWEVSSDRLCWAGSPEPSPTTVTCPMKSPSALGF